jgi:hypothetical protein
MDLVLKVYISRNGKDVAYWSNPISSNVEVPRPAGFYKDRSLTGAAGAVRCHCSMVINPALRHRFSSNDISSGCFVDAKSLRKVL